MGNKLHLHGNSKKPERNSPSRVRQHHHMSQSGTGNSEKIGISKIPPAPISMSSTNGKDVEKILKEIDKNPELRDINKLPRDFSKSDEINKSINLIQNKLVENSSSFDESVSTSERVKPTIKFETSTTNITNRTINHSNERKRNTLRSKSNVEDLSRKRQKLMRQIHKLNQLENEKQLKLLEQHRDLYVEQMKLQDSLIIEESLKNFTHSKDQSFFKAYDSKESNDSDSDDKLPFAKINSNHPLVPIYRQETRITSSGKNKQNNNLIYPNEPINNNLNGLRNHHSFTKSLYDFNDLNNESTMTDKLGKEYTGEYYYDYYDDDHKLNENELNLILMAIEKFEQIEKNNKKNNKNKSYRQSRYYFKDKQIYPQLDMKAVADLSTLNSVHKSTQSGLKQLELKKSDKLINDLKMVKDPPKQQQPQQQHIQQSSLNTSNLLQQSSSLSQVLKDIIIEYSNMNEEEFDKFKMDLNKDKIAKQVAEQQRVLEQQKIPKKILDAYRNPYYEHCSYGCNKNSESYYKRAENQLMSKSEVNAYNPTNKHIILNEMKRTQSFKAYESSNLKRAKSNLKKLASKKDGEQITMDNDEDLYDPTNFLFEEELKYHV